MHDTWEPKSTERFRNAILDCRNEHIQYHELVFLLEPPLDKNNIIVGSPNRTLFEVICYVRSAGRLAEFVFVVADYFPHNTELAKLRDELIYDLVNSLASERPIVIDNIVWLTERARDVFAEQIQRLEDKWAEEMEDPSIAGKKLANQQFIHNLCELLKMVRQRNGDELPPDWQKLWDEHGCK